MCVIIGLPAKEVLAWKSFHNMVMNNRDGWGLVTLDRGQMEVRKESPAKGNDPEALMEILNEYKDVDKFLHVRYNTVGETITENAHPFTVYNSDDNHRVEFMHNGTLSDFRPSYQSGDKRSDSRVFAEQFLSPLLYRWQGENGLADIEDTFLSTLLEKYFSYNNRGLLISNKLDPLFLGKWKSVKSEGGTDLAVSNDDYFSSVISSRDKFQTYTRTTVVQQGGTHTSNPQQALIGSSAGKKANEETDGGESDNVIPLREVASDKSNGVTKLSEVQVHKAPARFITPNEIANLMDLGGDELNHDAILYFPSIMPLELSTFFTSETESAVSLFFWMVECYVELNGTFQEAMEERDTAVEKYEKGTNAIAVMAKQLREAQEKASKLAVEVERWKAMYQASIPSIDEKETTNVDITKAA